MRIFSKLFRCKSILYFSYPSQFAPDPFISLSVLFVDNQIRFVSSHFFSNAPQTEPLISHSYQINSMPIRVSANPIFSLSVRFRSTAVQIDPFIGFSGRFGASPTRLRSFPFLGSSWLFDAFPYRIISSLIISFADPITAFPLRFLAIISIPRLLGSNLFHFPSIRSSQFLIISAQRCSTAICSIRILFIDALFPFSRDTVPMYVPAYFVAA